MDQGGEDPDGLCTEGLDAVSHGVVAIFRSIGDFGDPEVPTVSPPDTAHGLLRPPPRPLTAALPSLAPCARRAAPTAWVAARSTPGDGRFAK